MDFLNRLDAGALLAFNLILGGAMMVIVLVTRLGLGAAARHVDLWFAGLLLIILGRSAAPLASLAGVASGPAAFVGFVATMGTIFAGLTVQWEAIRQLRTGRERSRVVAGRALLATAIGAAVACTGQPALLLFGLLCLCVLLLVQSLRLASLYWGGRLLALCSLALLMFNAVELVLHLRGPGGPIDRHGLALEMIWSLFSTAGFLQCVYQGVRDKLMAAVVTDALTGALNRTGVMPVLRRDLDLVQRGSELSVALCDLDHFKGINDRYGHAVGDRVLQRFVMRAKTILRGSDLIGRWGGEEFLLVFPGSSLADATSVAQRVRQAIAELETDPAFTFSAGIANAKEACVQGDLEALLAVADRRLYLAKATRNATVAEDPADAGDPVAEPAPQPRTDAVVA